MAPLWNQKIHPMHPLDIVFYFLSWKIWNIPILLLILWCSLIKNNSIRRRKRLILSSAVHSGSITTKKSSICWGASNALCRLRGPCICRSEGGRRLPKQQKMIFGVTMQQQQQQQQQHYEQSSRLLAISMIQYWSTHSLQCSLDACLEIFLQILRRGDDGMMCDDVAMNDVMLLLRNCYT